MVMRRIPRFTAEPPQRLLASFRRTHRQALGHGIFVGLVAGAVLAGATVIALLVRRIAGGHGPPYTWTSLIYAFLVPLIVGILIGGSLGTRVGADADDLGVHAVPAAPNSFGGWPAITDIRAERRGQRTVIMLYMDNGKAVRLPAPYSGPILAHDASLERKFFTLLNLWETHRNWKSRT
jgi:hypothetical protein